MSWSDDEALNQLHRDVETLMAAIAAVTERLDHLLPLSRSQPRFPDSPAAWEEVLPRLLQGQLTEAERKVCARRIVGYSDREIAAELVIAETTARSHTRHICSKLGLEHARQIPFYVLSRLLERSPAV
jgi:ATP/maltotriose-dependent transcriptional regulator MalT